MAGQIVVNFASSFNKALRSAIAFVLNFFITISEMATFCSLDEIPGFPSPKPLM
jgi:hypothetical protein